MENKFYNIGNCSQGEQFACSKKDYHARRACRPKIGADAFGASGLMNLNLFYAMIGMAKRAGKVSEGEFIVKRAVKKNMARLVIIACNASDNTKKSIINSCSYYKVKYIEAGDMEALGKCVGAPKRAVISVDDDNFAKAVSDKII